MGKTLNKLNYLKETTSQIKTALNQFEAGITNDTFRSYVSKISDIYANWTKVTDEDSQLNLTPTRKGKMNLTLNSTELTQDGTPSPSSPVDVNVIKGDNNVKVENKNLAPSNWGENFVSRINDSSIASITTQDNRDCVKYTANAGHGDYDNKYLFKTNWKENTQYTISYFAYSSTGYLNLAIEYTDGTNTSMDGTPITNWAKITLTSTANKTIKYIRSRYTGGITYIDLDTFQVEEGIIATEYIEHQEQNYNISLASKNLFAGGNPFSFNVLLDYPLKLEAGTYYLKCGDMTQSPSGTSMEYPVIAINNQAISIPKNAKKTFTINSPIEKVNLYSNGWSYVDSINVTATISDLIISKEDVPYEPYQPTIEYCKIGDYADQIFKNTSDSPYYDNTLIENEWYLKKNIEKVFLDGSEDWTQTPDTSVSNFYIRVANEIVAYGTSGTGKSNYFKYTYANSAGNFYFASATRLILSMENTYTLETFKTWLSSHNTNVYYPLATPTYIQLSQENYPTLRNQLEEINTTPTSYSGTTNITQTNDDLPFNINASALMKGDE